MKLSKSSRPVAWFAGAVMAALAAAAPAEARSHSHLSLGLGLGFGGYGSGPVGNSGFFSLGDRHSQFSFGWSDPGYYAPSYYAPSYYGSGYYAPRYLPPPRWRTPASPSYRSSYAPGGVAIFSLFPSDFSARFTDDDRYFHQRAYEMALAAPVGEAMVWDQADAHGSITTTRDGQAGNTYCREFLENVTIQGEQQQAVGTACQNPDGSWRLVANQR